MKKCLHRVGTGLNYFQRADAIDRLKVSASQGLEDQTVIISQLVHTTLLPRAEVNTYWNLGKADFADVKSFPAHISSPIVLRDEQLWGKTKRILLDTCSCLDHLRKRRLDGTAISCQKIPQNPGGYIRTRSLCEIQCGKDFSDYRMRFKTDSVRSQELPNTARPVFYCRG